MPNETYTLNYTAEQINHRLDLINENKNLLPYPYNYSATGLPTWLEDVGDGSFLTKDYSRASLVELATYSLPAGTYIASVEITNIIDTTNVVEQPEFHLGVLGATQYANGQFTLTEPTTIQVTLRTPDTDFESGLLIGADFLIKPQIEKGTEKTAWVPYMDKIGTYVDRRFNGTNAKLKSILELMDCLEIE